MQKCPDNLTPLDDAFYDWFFTEKTYMSESDLNEVKDTIKVIFKKFYQLSESVKIANNKRSIDLTKEYQFIRDILVKVKGGDISEDEIYNKAKAYRLSYLITEVHLIGKRDEENGIYTSEKLTGGLFENAILSDGSITHAVMPKLWWGCLLSLNIMELVISLYHEYYKHLTEGISVENEFEQYHLSNFFPNFYQRNTIVEGNNNIRSPNQSPTQEGEITVLQKGVIDRWKEKIMSIDLYMKNERSYHDIAIYHKVLDKPFYLDTDTIEKLSDICTMVNLHVNTINKSHVLPVHNVNKLLNMNQDQFMEYLYHRIHK